MSGTKPSCLFCLHLVPTRKRITRWRALGIFAYCRPSDLTSALPDPTRPGKSMDKDKPDRFMQKFKLLKRRQPPPDLSSVINPDVPSEKVRMIEDPRNSLVVTVLSRTFWMTNECQFAFHWQLRVKSHPIRIFNVKLSSLVRKFNSIKTLLMHEVLNWTLALKFKTLSARRAGRCTSRIGHLEWIIMNYSSVYHDIAIWRCYS